MKSKAKHLAAWLSDPRSDIYFGRRFALKFAVAAQIMSGKGTLTSIAKEFGVTKQAVGIQARKFRRTFG